MRSVLLLFFFFSLSFSFSQDANSLYKEGIAFHDKGDYKQAIEKYRQALALMPSSGTLYYEMAYSFEALKQYDSAIVNADKAIAIGGDETKRMALVLKGSVLDDRGDTEESIRFYEKALKDYPTDYLLLFNYGISCSRANRKDDAEKSYIGALTSKITHPGSNLQLANLKKETGEKVKPMLGLYFFLLLENNTPRAKAAFKSLVELTSLEGKDSKQINVVIPSGSKKGEKDMTAAELVVSMLAMTINEIDKSTKADSSSRSFENRFVRYTEKFFTLTSELAENKKSSKKNKGKATDFWWTTYVPFFTELNKAGHTEAFSYHVMLAGENKVAEAWLNDNKEKRELFYLWLRNH